MLLHHHRAISFQSKVDSRGGIRSNVKDGVLAESQLSLANDSHRSESGKDHPEIGFTGYRGYCGHPGPVPVGRLGASDPDPNHENQASTGDPNEPCLFYSYTGCLKGHLCEYSHLIHADQVQAPEAKTLRYNARHRIRQRLTQLLSTVDVYSVHHELQREAKRSSYAKELIRKHFTGSSSSSSIRFWL